MSWEEIGYCIYSVISEIDRCLYSINYEHMTWCVKSLELVVWAASKLYPACCTVIAERLA